MYIYIHKHTTLESSSESTETLNFRSSSLQPLTFGQKTAMVKEVESFLPELSRLTV